MAKIAVRGVRLEALRVLAQRGEQTPGAVADNLTSEKRSAVYMALQRMEVDGLVTSWREAKQTLSGSPRRFYTITGLGERALRLGELAERIEAGEGEIIIEGGKL